MGNWAPRRDQWRNHGHIYLKINFNKHIITCLSYFEFFLESLRDDENCSLKSSDIISREIYENINGMQSNV